MGITMSKAISDMEQKELIAFVAELYATKEEYTDSVFKSIVSECDKREYVLMGLL